MRLELRQDREVFLPPDISCMGCKQDMEAEYYGEENKEAYVICYVTAGQMNFNGNRAGEGQGFLVCPGQEKICRTDGEGGEKPVYLWVSSDDERMEVLFETFHADPMTRVFDYKYVFAVRAAFDRLVLLRGQNAGYFELYSVFMDIMQAHFSCVEGKERDPSEIYLQYAVHYIHDHYASEIRIDKLARQIGISQPHLYNIFQANLGCSPKEYINRSRAKQAMKLLVGTNLTVAEIGKAVGYEDPMGFSRFFSRRQGVSPSKFREAHQARSPK